MADEKAAKKQKQIKKAEELQDLILDDFIALAKNGGLSATDRATAIRFLQSNGWDLDPSRVPQSLKDILTRRVAPDEDLPETQPGERRLKAI